MSLKPYKPLPDFLTISKSNIHGLGVIATEDIDENTNLGISHIKYQDSLVRTPIGGFINHSDKPNCKYEIDDNKLRLITIKQIKKGKEVTVSYRGWYSDEELKNYK